MAFVAGCQSAFVRPQWLLFAGAAFVMLATATASLAADEGKRSLPDRIPPNIVRVSP